MDGCDSTWSLVDDLTPGDRHPGGRDLRYRPVVGDEVLIIRRPRFRGPDIAFIMECTENSVRGMFRRGEGMSAAGVSPDEVLAAGALPSLPGEPGTVGPLTLAGHPRVRGDRMRERALCAVAAGALVVPRADRPSELPPRVSERLDVL